MIVLPEKFTRREWTFEQIKRDKNIAIYFKKSDYGATSWEVIIIQEVEDTEIMGNFVAAHEKFPSNESWGVLGWSYMNLYDAEKKFNKLIKNKN